MFLTFRYNVTNSNLWLLMNHVQFCCCVMYCTYYQMQLLLAKSNTSSGHNCEQQPIKIFVWLPVIRKRMLKDQHAQNNTTHTRTHTHTYIADFFCLQHFSVAGIQDSRVVCNFSNERWSVWMRHSAPLWEKIQRWRGVWKGTSEQTRGVGPDIYKVIKS